jgi:hypothetical protein
MLPSLVSAFTGHISNLSAEELLGWRDWRRAAIKDRKALLLEVALALGLTKKHARGYFNISIKSYKMVMPVGLNSGSLKALHRASMLQIGS